MVTRTQHNRVPTLQEIEIGEADIDELTASLAATLDAQNEDITNVGTFTAESANLSGLTLIPTTPPENPDLGFTLFVDENDTSLKAMDSGGNVYTMVE